MTDKHHLSPFHSRLLKKPVHSAEHVIHGVCACVCLHVLRGLSEAGGDSSFGVAQPKSPTAVLNGGKLSGPCLQPGNMWPMTRDTLGSFHHRQEVMWIQMRTSEAPCLLELMSIPSSHHGSAMLMGSTSGQTSKSLLSNFSQRSTIHGGLPRKHTFLGLLEITSFREPQAWLCALAHQHCLLRAVKTGPGE